MKQKLLLLLKPKLANKGFSQKTIEGLADILVKNLTDESTEDEVNTAIDGVLPYAEIMQAENTRYANEVKKGIKPVENPEIVADEPEKDETPAWAKALIGEVQTLKAEKATNTRREQYAKALEGTSDAFKTKALKDFDRLAFKDEDDFSSWLTESTEDARNFVQGETNNGLGGDRPAGSKAAPAGGAKPSDAEVDALATAIL